MSTGIIGYSIKESSWWLLSRLACLRNRRAAARRYTWSISTPTLLPRFARRQWPWCRTQERVEDRISDEAEHADQAAGQFQRERRRVVSRRGAGRSAQTCRNQSLCRASGITLKARLQEFGAAVSAGLPLHQDELDVILDDRVGFVRLAEETATVAGGLQGGIGDLVPDDGGQVVETDAPAMFLDGSVQWDHRMAPVVLPPCQAHVSYHANQPSSGNQNAKTVIPDPVECLKEHVVIRDAAQLPLTRVVLLQRPVRRGSQDQVNALGRKKVQFPRVAPPKLVVRRQRGQDGVLPDYGPAEELSPRLEQTFVSVATATYYCRPMPEGSWPKPY